MIGKSFFPPIAAHHARPRLDFAGWATPTEAAGVGPRARSFSRGCQRPADDEVDARDHEIAALTNALVFFIFFGATLFSFVFRALGGDEIVTELLKAPGSTPAGRS